MATEESPLLRNQLHADTAQIPSTLSNEDVYNLFNHKEKRIIVAIVSLTGLLTMLVSASLVPSIPQISKDLQSTPTAVSLGISLSVFSISIGVMFWSAYTSFYGRRMVYICGMPITIFGSFAVAASTSLNTLLFWRFVQTFGCCSGSFSLGAAAIGDIYKVEERGTSMGTFFGAMLFGLAIAPPLGGFFAQYWSWRGFQALLGALGALQLLLLVSFLPETIHPGTRGADKVQGPRKLFVLINPLRCLTFLRSPNIMTIALANACALLSGYTLFTPIAYTIGAKYGITSEAMIGILILPHGVGSCVGAMIAGRISDRAIRQAKERRKGVWIPEDRLRAVWLGGLVLLPISVTLAGFTTEYVDDIVGLVICLVCLFCNGLGIELVLSPIGAYAIDIMPFRSAEVVAAITSLRSVLLATVSTLIIPAVEFIGVTATNSISGALALLGYGLIWLTIRYGQQMRAYVDIGYPDFHARAAERE